MKFMRKWTELLKKWDVKSTKSLAAAPMHISVFIDSCLIAVERKESVVAQIVVGNKLFMVGISNDLIAVFLVKFL